MTEKEIEKRKSEKGIRPWRKRPGDPPPQKTFAAMHLPYGKGLTQFGKKQKFQEIAEKLRKKKEVQE